MPDDLEERFDAATEGIYSRVLIEAGYRAANYHRMLIGYGGAATAKTLVNFSSVSGGYAALSEIKRLDLTVEALIHDSTQWPRSFS